MIENMSNLWVIGSFIDQDPDTGEDLYWSNEDGWVSLDSENVVVVDSEDKEQLNLPIGGTWTRMDYAVKRVISQNLEQKDM